MRRWILRLGLLGLVAAVIPACGGGSGGVVVGGTGSISVSGLESLTQGGRGLTLDGGDGASFNVYAATGSDIRILPSGSINSIVSPRVLKPYLGTNPRIVTSSQTWTVDVGSGGMLQFFNTQIPGNGPGDATGLWVMPGVTLTIYPNWGTDQLILNFSNAVFIEGTVRIGFRNVTTTNDQLSDRGADFNLGTENLVITSSGSIITAGRNDSADSNVRAGRGGDIDVNASGTIINAGTLDSRGGNGSRGGRGGSVNLNATTYDVYNTGTIDTSGGEGDSIGFVAIASIGPVGVPTSGQQVYQLEAPAPSWVTPGRTVNITLCANSNNNGTSLTVVAVSGADVTLSKGSGTAELASSGQMSVDASVLRGGRGGSISLNASNLGGVFNTGTLMSRGGNGAGGGGNGDTINLDTNSGAVTSSGTLNSSGGNGLGTSVGGNGRSINLNAGGTLRVTGVVTSRGGNGSGTSLSGGSDGGDGGSINFSSFSSGSIAFTNLSGGLAVGTTLNSGGGDGAKGGNAGSVNIDATNNNTLTPGQDIVWILGYAVINTAGGDAQLDGASAGGIDIYNDNSSIYGVDYQGSIRNEVVLSARGGNGTLGTGGSADDINIETNFGGINIARSVVNTASLDARGGSGALASGAAGDVFMYDTFLVQNSGTITVDGGSATSFGAGGNSGQILLVSDDVLTNTAALSARGGQGTNFNGGNGGDITLGSRMSSSTGSLNADGGNGGSNPGNFGGDGGFIVIVSTDTVSVVSGTLYVGAGTGEALVGTGFDGQVLIDGIRRLLTNGAITLP